MPADAYTWDAFEHLVVDDPRPLATGADPITLHHHGRTYQRVGDSGWHMMVCWHAGPANVLRVGDDPSWHTVLVQQHRPVGYLNTTEPRSERDQHLIENGVNEYLAGGGIPPRPREFVWLIAPPSGRSLDELWPLVREQELRIPSRAPRPPEVAAAISTAVRSFYR